MGSIGIMAINTCNLSELKNAASWSVMTWSTKMTITFIIQWSTGSLPLPFSLWISLVILLGRRKNMNTTACLCVVILDDRSGNTYAIFVGVVGDNGKPSLEGRSSSVNDGCAMSSTNEEQFFFLPYIVHYILQGGQAHKWLLMKEKFEWFCRSQLLLATSGNLYMFVCLFFVFKEGKLIVFFWF